MPATQKWHSKEYKHNNKVIGTIVIYSDSYIIILFINELEMH